MNWDETMKLLHEGDWKGRKMGFQRMEELLKTLGSPEKKLRFVHVAGTNGKGSASVMLASILKEAGLKTGLYISPHIREINERWSINGENISDSRLRKLSERVRRATESMEDAPTSFELLTVLGFLYFYEESCDIVVLEVGLGGRLDATNVIPCPECSLIMNIGLEHTELLGNSLEKIAYEKGGIIKKGGNVVLYRQSDAVTEVIRKLCEERGAKLRITEKAEDLEEKSVNHSEEIQEAGKQQVSDSQGQTENLESLKFLLYQHFSYKDYHDLELSLLGAYQRDNAAAVLECVDVLREKGYALAEDAVRRGLRSVKHPGRFEILSRNPFIIVDGAHNPNGVEALLRSLGEVLKGRKIYFLFGVMQNKNYHEMLRMLAEFASGFIATVPRDERALSMESLLQEIRKDFTGPVVAFSHANAGLRYGLELLKKEREAALVCLGSLYQVSELREYFQKYGQ